MSTNVVMPQMGESVAEGTIVRWIKKVGDTVDRDEPLFEISTDKVDAEIPSPGAGTLLAIHVKEGETVPVDTVVAVIGEAGTQVRPAEPRLTPATASERSAASAAPRPAIPSPRPAPGPQPQRRSPAEGGPRRVAPPVSENRSVADGTARTDAVPGIIERRRRRSSPVVRRIAADHGIDLSQLTGSGISGRITRRDIEALVEDTRSRQTRPSAPVYAPGDNVRLEKMSIMRRKIAEHMVASVQTSPHVYSTFEVDFSRVDELRRKHKARYEAAGAKLTFTVFIARATADAIRECPFANASIDGDTIVYKQDINLGIAVALEQGLIVPVIRSADRLDFLALSRAVQDVAERARTKQLKVDEVQGGTFTITNPGIFGAVMGLPIINQPQVAILAVGAIEKRAVVVGDRIEARPTSYVTLGHDHRLIDGAEGARFLRAIKERIEQFDEGLL